MHWNWKDKAGWFWLPFGALLFAWNGGLAGWPEGGQDSWNHFLYARWAWTHPELYLDQWGKPLYTFLSAPFSILGIRGAIAFNIACTLLSAWLLYRSAWQQHWHHAWLAYPFTFFAPILFGNTVSALTEPLNATLLALLIWFFSTGRDRLAVITASLLPLVRSEGYVLLAALGVFLFLEKKYRLLPWLLSGTVLLALAGWAIHGDITWIVSSNPYIRFEQESRWHPGSGSLLHYVQQQRHIIGSLGLALALAGWLFAAFDMRSKEQAFGARLVFLLCGGMAAAYFLAHTMIWWMGSMGSHGLIRVFAVIVPCWVMAQLWLVHRLAQYFGKARWLPPVYLALVPALAWFAYDGNGYPAPWKAGQAVIAPPPQAVTVQQALAWGDSMGLQNRILVHQLPYIDVLLGIDPFTKPELARSFRIWSIDWRDGFRRDWMPDSCLVIYDGYHAARDGFLPLDSLMAAPHYRLLKHFPHPAPPEKGSTQFDVWVFEKRQPFSSRN